MGRPARASRIVLGLAPGLFVARVVAEVTRAPWPPLALIALAVAVCAMFVWLSSRRQSAWRVPALVLLVYVFWPHRDGRVALAVAAIALLAGLVDLSSRFTFRVSRFTFHVSRFTFTDWLTFLVTLAVYVATLQKDILPADSGEFQLVVTRLGILHQPGYPLYTLAGRLFTLLPVGTPALRLNLMSAVLAAGTLTLVGATVRRMIARALPAQGESLSVWAGLSAVLALGTATTFWSQATTANIRMPMAFLTAWCLYLLVAYRVARDTEYATRNTQCTTSHSDRNLTVFALAFSLALVHYFPLVFMGAFFGLFLMLVDPALIRQPRRWRKPLAAFALAQLVWLYLPIRAALDAALGATTELAGLTTLKGFLWYALGQGFAGDMLAFAGPHYLPARLALLPTLFPFQMNLALLVAAFVGASLLAWRDWRAGLMLIGAFVVHTFIAITYRAPQTVEYEMPAYVVLAMIVGYGVGQIKSFNYQLSNIKYQVANVLVAGVIVAGLANGMAHAPSFVALASDRSTREYVEPILRDAPRGAIILADWHFATPMWYLQQIEGRRPDVEVRYVYPVGGQEWSQVWRGLIEDNIKQRPVVVTHFWGLQYPAMSFTFEPFHQAWLVRPKPNFDVPSGLEPITVEFDSKIRLIKYQLSNLQPLTSNFQSQVSLTLVWQTLGPLDRDYSFTVHLVDAGGALHAARDRSYPTRSLAPGEVRVDQFTLPLQPALVPGRYALQVGVYSVPPEGGFQHLLTNDREQMATVGAFDLAPLRAPLATLHSLDVPLEGGPTLEGVDYDLSVPTIVRVYLHWRGPGAAGVVGQIGDVPVAAPALARDARAVTAHDVPRAARLSLSLARRGAGAWGWPVVEAALPAYRPNDRYVLLGDQMVLTGVDLRGEAAPGQWLDVTLRYLALKPLATNYVASVRVEGAEGAWRVQSDDHPAGNAFPTLKWIAGSVVTDWRRLVVPAEAQPGRAVGHLTVYDEVREAVLAPLDARMGDSVPLGEWTVKR